MKECDAMDFRQIEYVIKVAELRSISKAARDLYISQPTLSSIIAKTEQEMGLQLFDRSAHPLALTLAGEEFVKATRQMEFQLESLHKKFKDIANSRKGRICVAIPAERGAFMLPKVLPEFYCEYPGVEVKTVFAKASSLESLVLNGKADFAILPAHVPLKQLQVETIYEEELLLVATKGSITPDLLINERTVNLAKLKDFPFVLLEEGHGIRSALDLLFHHFGTTPKIVMETYSNGIAYRLATSGMGAAIVPAMTVQLIQGIGAPCLYSISAPPVMWDIVAAWRKKSYISNVEREFVRLCRNAID